MGSGRRALREELQATWSVYTPRRGGVPFTKKDLADANEQFARGVPSPPSVRETGSKAEKHGGARKVGG